MTIKTRSSLFIFFGMIVNIVITIAIIAVLTIGVLMFLLKGLHLTTESLGLQVILPFVFIIGLIIGITLYTRLAGWVIRTFHLEDKLSADLVKRYNKPKNERL